MDAELYLRLLLEECLADPSRAGFYATATALVSVGAVSPDTAQGLVGDLELARQIRFGAVSSLIQDHFIQRAHRSDWRAAAQPAGLASGTVAVGPATIDFPDGPLTLSWITLGPPASLRGSLALDPDRAAPTIGRFGGTQGSRRPRPVPIPPAAWMHPMARPEPWLQLHVVDDQGNRYGFGGDGGSNQTDATYTFATELVPDPAADVRWFEVIGPGEQVARLPVAAPSVVPHPATDVKRRSLAELYLLHELNAAVVNQMVTGAGATPRPEGRADACDIAEAFVGAGLLPAGDPLVEQARLVRNGDPPDPGLDRRLRSALRTPGERNDGRGDRVWPVGIAVSGPGFALRVDVVAHTAAETRLFGRLQPGAFRNFVPYVLAARDDLDQWYLVDSLGGGGTDLEMSVEWHLHPCLDPAATGLDLVVTGLDGETEIPLSLP